jgi:hypothetical protein
VKFATDCTETDYLEAGLRGLKTRKEIKKLPLSSPLGHPGQAAEKHPSAALRSSLVIATYREVRLIPPDFARLASEYFLPACEKNIFIYNLFESW